MSISEEFRPGNRPFEHALDEAQEIEAFLAGSPDNLIDRTIRRITSLRAVSELVDRDEVVQNTRLALIQIFRANRYQPGRLMAFVRRVTEIQVLREYRKSRILAERHVTEVDPDVNADSRPNVEESRELRERLARGRVIIFTLGAMCRRLLIMRYCRGMSYRDIGEQIGLSEGAARVRAFRCLQECEEINARLDAAE